MDTFSIWCGLTAKRQGEKKKKKEFTFFLYAVYSPWKKLCVAQTNASLLITGALLSLSSSLPLHPPCRSSLLLLLKPSWFLFFYCFWGVLFVVYKYKDPYSSVFVSILFFCCHGWDNLSRVGMDRCDNLEEKKTSQYLQKDFKFTPI